MPTMVAAAVLMVISLAGIGFALLSSGSPSSTALAAPGGGTPTETGMAAPSATPRASKSPTPRASPSAKPTATKSRTPVRPIPTKKPPKKDLPPPPHNTPTTTPPASSTDSRACPSLTGTNASKAAVRDALVAAGARQYWNSDNRPSDLTGTLPKITIPAALMKAIAWQESGWQSKILACDGGIGTMQVMPPTASWANDRFGTSYDVQTLAGNTALGAQYLQWEVMYFGLYYFGDFDLNATAPVGPGGEELTLRDVVVAAYNVGAGALEIRADSGDYLKIPNQRYVDNVLALTTECVCLDY